MVTTDKIRIPGTINAKAKHKTDDKFFFCKGLLVGGHKNNWDCFVAIATRASLTPVDETKFKDFWWDTLRPLRGTNKIPKEIYPPLSSVRLEDRDTLESDNNKIQDLEKTAKKVYQPSWFRDKIHKSLVKSKAYKPKGDIVTRRLQARFLSECLGFLNYGTHGIGVQVMADFFTKHSGKVVSIKTASAIRKSWEEKGFIIKVESYQRGRKTKGKTDIYKAGPKLLFDCSTRLSLDETVEFLREEYPLDTGITRENTPHWFLRLANIGADDDTIIEILVENDLSGHRVKRGEGKRSQYRSRIKALRKRFKPF